MEKLSPLRLSLAAAAGGLVLLGFAAAAGAFAGRAPEPQQIAAPAQASPPRAQSASPAQTFAGPGYLPTPEALAQLGITNPIKIERDYGRIEIKHHDAQGRIVETYLDAATGAVVKQEIKSVDANSERERDHD
jgi:hypothetical protein